ncbi:MAG: hypothetical protein J6I49_06240 [Bacteroidales bacterium]|nr:hypothetical protein [Bacteroidales bacterium]
MTKPHKLMTLALGAMILFAACGKEDSTSTTPTDPASDGEKRLEWWEQHFYEKRKDHYEGARDFSRYKFIWENGKVKELEVYDDENQYFGSIEIIYENGKAKEIRGGSTTTTLLYTGDMVTGSISTYRDGYTSSYTYEYNASGEIVRKTRSDGGTTYYTWENGNLVEERYTSGTHTDTYTYTCDSKINPMRQVPIELVFHEFTYLPMEMLSKNSVTGSCESYSYGYTGRDYTYSHTYDGDYTTSWTQEWDDSYEGKYRYYFRYSDGSGMDAPLCRINVEGNVFGDGIYILGDEVILYAYSNSTQRFLHWGDGNTDNPRIFTATGDVTLQPVYEPIEE